MHEYAVGLEERTESAQLPEHSAPASTATRVASVILKPAARGWIHAVMTPLVLAQFMALVVLAPTAPLRASCMVFGLCSLLLFGNSAVYHLGHWTRHVHSILRRIDHSNIFLLIAGTYTPLAAALLSGGARLTVLLVIWIGAAAGMVQSIFFVQAPRWVYVPLYILLGWVAVWFLPEFSRTGGAAVLWLIIAGGIAYTIGAVAYAFKKPNPWPRVWGFHEFFHLGTALGYICHSVAIWLAIFA
ncbi:MAG: hemolysin III family protein [Actinomycetaceae bacterium]|nr:hemolysin III family protein [Actinomycetaceae bacterium]MDY6083560.1 hemolysin III family protein [Actinomycetaceae bacterium]